MIYFLNRGLILEQMVEKALETYFSLLRVDKYYKNFSVAITNDHPFAQLLLTDTSGKSAASLFPVIVVATESDIKPDELSNLTHFVEEISVSPEDLHAEGGMKSAIETRYQMITPKIMEELRAAMEAREDKRIFGTSFFIRRRDRISIEIWAENPQLKNELYELVRLFVGGFMNKYLTELYKGYFQELNNSGESPLVIFDSSVRGQRSNNFNIDFGIELVGGQITFDADYIIEQTVIDTEIVDTKNILLEVINHAKNYEHTTTSWVSAVRGGGNRRNRSDRADRGEVRERNGLSECLLGEGEPEEDGSSAGEKAPDSRTVFEKEG
jgi:hypothetical protein